MAVLANKRNKSEIQYIQTAKELQVLIFDLVSRCPKRYTNLLGNRLFDLACKVHNEVRAANIIYPTNKHELQMRKDHLVEARKALNDLDPLLEMMYDMLNKNRDKYPWTESKMMAILAHIDQEQKLIAGVLHSDNERYKSLLE